MDAQEQKIEETENLESQETTPPEPTLEQQLADMRDQWLRSMAECENLRRRSTKDREEALKYGATSFARDIVSTFDNLERALQAADNIETSDESIKNLVVGIEMTLKDLENVFTRQHIKRVDALHAKFDPNHHQAMFEIESEEHEPGTVLQVVQSGFLMHDRLLRPAMVGVAKVKAS
jgi:molecular chaperone GrpE